MQIVEPSIEILDKIDAKEILKKLESCGRICYKSENMETTESTEDFLRRIISNGHCSVLEHFSFSVKFIVDRGISHEIVRHRIASYSQESTRYCNYSKDRFKREITVIKPIVLTEGTYLYQNWLESVKMAEKTYFELVENGITAGEARAVLPTCLKTELIMTANLRQWRYFISLRNSKKCHSQMRYIAYKLLEELKQKLPVIFEDIGEE